MADETPKLKPIHWDLYRFIEFYTHNSDFSIPQRAIYVHLLEKGHKVSWNTSQNQHNDHCRWLYDLVEEINGSPEVDHIIVHDREYRYRFGNQDEVNALYEKYTNTAMKALKRRKNLMWKIGLNGQGKLVSNQGHEITDGSKAEPFHETINKGELDGKED